MLYEQSSGRCLVLEIMMIMMMVVVMMMIGLQIGLLAFDT